MALLQHHLLARNWLEPSSLPSASGLHKRHLLHWRLSTVSTAGITRRRCSFHGNREAVKEKYQKLARRLLVVAGDGGKEENFWASETNRSPVEDAMMCVEDRRRRLGKDRDSRLSQGRFLPPSFRTEQDRRPGDWNPRERSREKVGTSSAQRRAPDERCDLPSRESGWRFPERSGAPPSHRGYETSRRSFTHEDRADRHDIRASQVVFSDAHGIDKTRLPLTRDHSEAFVQRKGRSSTIEVPKSHGRVQDDTGISHTHTTTRLQSPLFSHVSDGISQESFNEQLSRREANSSGPDFITGNPLIERLQPMQEELEKYFQGRPNAFEHSDGRQVQSNRGHPSNTVGTNFYNELPAMASIAEKLSSIPGSRKLYDSEYRIATSDCNTTSMEGMASMVGGRGSSSIASERFAQKVSRETLFPWEKPENDKTFEGDYSREPFSKVKLPSLAELTIPERELQRLRSLAMQTMHHISIGSEGVTNGIVELIYKEWSNSEVARVHCHGLPAQNMKQTHDTLEERTGGLVVWRTGSRCLLYRGEKFDPTAVKGLLRISVEFAGNRKSQKKESQAGFADSSPDEVEEDKCQETFEQSVEFPSVSDIYNEELEREMEEILSGLGPRCSDWTGAKPVPLDADALCKSKVSFKKFARTSANGAQSPSLTDFEMANLRRLGRPIPPQFVLGIHKDLEGLALAIAKLWERREIAKIAVKPGVSHRNHERMARQLKRLTGGVLLSRDKYFIVIYRGKDFLSPSAIEPVEEQKVVGKEGEEMKLQMKRQVLENPGESSPAAVAPSTSKGGEASVGKQRKLDYQTENIKPSESFKMIQLQKRLSLTMGRKLKAVREIEKIKSRESFVEPPVHRETISEEERHTYLKLGLKMHSFLLLGRRGVYAGTIENMHMHWKHKDLVKIIYKARSRVDLEQVARMLEYESGGILVGTGPSSKGQCIIVFRGKNYQRPPSLRPPNLLNRRQAYSRFIEMQRQQTLENQLLDLERDMNCLRHDLSELKESKRRFNLAARKSGDSVNEDADKSNAISGSNLFEGHDEGNEHEHEIAREHDKMTADVRIRTKDPVVIADVGDEVIRNEHDKAITNEYDLVTANEHGVVTANENDEVIANEHNEAVTNDRSECGGNPSPLETIFRADPLTRKEKLILRHKALKDRIRTPHFTVGQRNVVAGLAMSIRQRFRRRALVNISVRKRARGTPVEEIIHQLEAATGGTLVSREHSKVILYRGWPEGQERPTPGIGRWEEIPPHLRRALIAEEEVYEDYLHESDIEDSDKEQEMDIDEGDDDQQVQGTVIKADEPIVTSSN